MVAPRQRGGRSNEKDVVVGVDTLNANTTKECVIHERVATPCMVF